MVKKKKSMKSKTIAKKKSTASKKKRALKNKKKVSTIKKTQTTRKSETKKSNKTLTNNSNKSKQLKEVSDNKKDIAIELPKRKSSVTKEEVNKVETKKSINVNRNKKPKKVKRVSNVQKIERTKKNSILSTIKKYRRKIKIYGIFSVISKRTCAVFISGFVIIVFLLVGLNYVAPKTELIDLESISQDIDQLKTVKFNINDSNNIVNSSKAYNNLTNYYLYDYESTFNIKSEWINDAVIKYNKNNKGLYIAILPNSGFEENIKNGINRFLRNNNIDADYFVYDGYMFYINSSNNNSVISKIKQTQIRVFDILEELNSSDIEELFGISSSLYTDYVVKKAMLKSEVTGYMIFKPKNKDAALKIDCLLDEYFQKLEEKYANDESKLALIKTRYEGTYNRYLVYLISKDNELVNQLIKK